VVTLSDEDFLRRREELATSRRARQPGTSARRTCLNVGHNVHPTGAERRSAVLVVGVADLTLLLGDVRGVGIKW
jgi:hypothetical protein